MKLQLLEYGHGFSLRSTGDNPKELIFLERRVGWTRPLVDAFLRGLETALAHQRTQVLNHLAGLHGRLENWTEELEDLFICTTSS